MQTKNNGSDLLLLCSCCKDVRGNVKTLKSHWHALFTCAVTVLHEERRNELTKDHTSARIAATLRMCKVQTKWKLITVKIQGHQCHTFFPLLPQFSLCSSCWSIKSMETQSPVLSNSDIDNHRHLNSTLSFTQLVNCLINQISKLNQTAATQMWLRIQLRLNECHCHEWGDSVKGQGRLGSALLELISNFLG